MAGNAGGAGSRAAPARVSLREGSGQGRGHGLGTLREEADTSELRDALAARLGDEDATVFGEALVGLANRKDPRALEPARAALAGGKVRVYELEAAGALGDPSFYPLLLALRDWKGDASTYFRHVLEDVIARFEGGGG